MYNQSTWTRARLASPTLEVPAEAIVARHLPTVTGGNRLQTMNLYLPATPRNIALVGQTATSLPASPYHGLPNVQVHVHGGAWRDPMTDASSVEAAAAHALADPDSAIAAVASINYTITQFPLHPVAPYDATKDVPKDPAREAVHPQHVGDVYRGLAKLGTLGLTDGSFIVTSHSCGACIAMQATLMPPGYFGLPDDQAVPVAAATVGLNGLYDLPALVHDLDPKHELTGGDYRIMLTNAFGPDEHRWAAASPARFDPHTVAARIAEGKAPALVLLDQSVDDQLVPVNQRERLAAMLAQVEGLDLVIGHRCTGKHSEPWQKGDMIWHSVRDVLARLSS